MGKRRNENNIIISFINGSRDDVCGSSVIVNYPTKDNKRKNLLLDLGMMQGSMSAEIEYSSNKKS